MCLRADHERKPNAAARLSDGTLTPSGPLRKPEADCREGPIKADSLSLRRIDTAVHGTEEIIGAIAKCDLRIWRLPRNACEAAQIGNSHIPAAWRSAMRCRNVQVLVGVPIIIRGLMIFVHTLTAKQNRPVYSPVQPNAARCWIAEQICGGIPRKRRTHAVEVPFRGKFCPKDMIKAVAVYVRRLRLSFNIGVRVKLRNAHAHAKNGSPPLPKLPNPISLPAWKSRIVWLSEAFALKSW